MSLALEILTLAVGAVAMLLVLPRALRQPRPRGPSSRPIRPADLERVERVVTARLAASGVHATVRPLLAELGFAFGQPVEDSRDGMLPRLAWVACAGLGGTVASALVLLVATSHVPRSLGVTLAGTAAAVIVVALLSRAWRS